MIARLLLTVVALSPTIALADPCTAPLPKPGTSFSGPVRYIGDGDSLCVGISADPASWIEVRLEDFYAAELHKPGGAAAKAGLEAVTRGRSLTCRAGAKSYDRVVARCTLNGTSVADLMRRRGIPEGGRGR